MESGSLSVVVPVYNEEENIAPLLGQLQAALANWPGEVELLFVDDGSTDATLEILKRAQTSEPRIRIAHFRRNLGQTAAMMAGFHLARGNAVVTLDGDLQNDPAEVPRLAQMLSGLRRGVRHSGPPARHLVETPVVPHRQPLSQLDDGRRHRGYGLHAESLPA